MLFAYELALALGQPSVERMLSEMSASEFSTWMSFWQLRPFGERVNHLMLGQLSAITANAHRKPSTRPFEPADFIPKTRPPDIREQVIAVFSQFPRKRNG